MKASDIVLDSNVSMLLKGTYGFGKTLAAASFALDGPIYLAYFDKKKPIELVTYFSKHRPEILRNIEYDVYGSHNANEFLNKLIDLARDCRYSAVVLDSVTNFTSAAVNWSLGFRSSKLKGKDKIMPDFDEYKVETSLVTQCLDICRSLPCHIIWTAHPVQSIKIEGSGSSIKVTKTNPIVTYGSKVAGIIPGNFSEIYHFSKLNEWDSATGKSKTKYIVDTEAVGDDYAKSNLGLKASLDITDRLFYEVWKAEVNKLREVISNDLNNHNSKPINPFSTEAATEETTQSKWRT
jgi:hypothetical protein